MSNPSNPYQVHNPETVITLRMLGDIRDRRFVAGLSGNASGPQIVKALEEEIVKLRNRLNNVEMSQALTGEKTFKEIINNPTGKPMLGLDKIADDLKTDAEFKL
jgi:hypothetical protein